MPPKKKDDKGKVSELTDTADEQKVALETELLVSVLKSRLGRYREAGEKLAVEGFKLADELAKQRLTLQDINEFLTNELKARSVATTQLEERVVELTRQMQDAQKEAQAEVARIRAEAALQVSAAEVRAESLAAQLDGSADFLGRRGQLEAELVDLKEQLAAKHKEAEQRLSDMERRHLQDKEKIKQEMTAKIRETKLTMAQLADQHLESSTKRTLVENEAMAAELAYHSAQSSRMAEANNTLRAEAAEMRRQLAVAQKTVESTARKNLLLQQTIKAILKCLQEEGPSAATAASVVEAAGTAQRLQDCGIYKMMEAAGGNAAYDKAVQQRQQDGEQQHAPVACSDGIVFPTTEGDHAVSCTEELLWMRERQQQQQHVSRKEEGPASADVTVDILEQLEHKVVNLSDELDAAKQALASALQGLIPDSATGAITVVYKQQQKQQDLFTASRDSNKAGAQLTGTRFSPSHESSKALCCSSSTTALAVPGSPSGSSSSRSGPSTGRGRTRNRSRSPASCRLLQGLTAWGNTCDSSWGDTCAGGPGAGAAAMAAALEDGVAAFVLYCVQQLRRGTPQATAAVAARKDSSCRAGLPSSSSEAFGSFAADGASGGTSTCSSPTGRGRQQGRGAATAAVSVRSVSPSLLALGLNAQSMIGYASADSDSAISIAPTSPAASAVNEGAIREQLARLLLDQLHGYAQHKVAAFQGMQLETTESEAVATHKQQQRQQAEPESLQCQPAAVPQASEGAGKRGNSRGRYLATAEATPGNSDSISQLLQEGPADHPLLLLLPGAATLPSNRSSPAASHQGLVRTQGALAGLQALPPLHSLLDMMQQQRSQTSISSPTSTATQPHPASAGSGPAAAGDGQPGTRSSTEDLFGALLSDVRPWGGAVPAADSRSQVMEGLSSTVRDRGGRSPSPLGLIHQLIGESGTSPKPSRPTATAAAQASGAGIGNLSNSSSCSSFSAGRLVKVGEVVGLASNLGKQHNEQDSNGLQAAAVQLNAIKNKTST